MSDVLARLRVDRSSPVPYHAQLAASFRELIRAGWLRVGDPLPAEPTLARSLGVSRPVVRQALGALAAEGLVARTRGRGTFVTPMRIHERFVASSTGFYEDMARQGYRVQSEVLSHRVEAVGPEVSQFFGTPPDARFHVLVRRRRVADQIVQVVRDWVPLERLGDIDVRVLEEGSLYALLAAGPGGGVSRVHQRVSVALSDEGLAPMLLMRPRRPVLVIRGEAWDRGGMPMDRYEAYHRGDIAEFEFHVTSQEEARTS